MNTPYYKLTPIAEAPKENGFYWAHAEDYERPGIAEYKDGVWLKGTGVFRGSADTQITHYLSPVLAVGAVWRKASERLPSIFDSHERHYRVDGKKVEGGRFYKSASGDFVFEYRHHSGFITDADLSSVEWLDESACDRVAELEAKNNALRNLTRKVYARMSEREQELRKEVERLKAVIADAHSFGWVDALLNNELSEEESFQNFKTEHNL